jgi:hypothetical protein
MRGCGGSILIRILTGLISNDYMYIQKPKKMNHVAKRANLYLAKAPLTFGHALTQVPHSCML